MSPNILEEYQNRLRRNALIGYGTTTSTYPPLNINVVSAPAISSGGMVGNFDFNKELKKLRINNLLLLLEEDV